VKSTILLFLLCAPALGDIAAGRLALKNGDYAAALREFMPLAKQGNAVAQWKLGSMYYYGWGVQQDDKEALRWSRLAADQGNAAAQSNLGAMYHSGRGVPQDDKAAVRWFRLAADQGDPDAQGLLGDSYSKGLGVPQDYVQAHMWFNLAGASGNAIGIENRDSIASKMTPDQIAEAQRRAREWKPKAGRQLMQSSNTMDWPFLIQIIIACATCFVPLVTWVLVKRQISVAERQLKEQISIAKEQSKEQTSIAKEQVNVQLYLEIRKDFDGDRLVDARERLAKQLLRNTRHDKLQEDVMNFFEDMGMLLRRGYLDRDMVWETFSYYAKMWWSACKAYVIDERERARDKTFFTNFGEIAEQMCEDEAKRRNMTRAEIEPSQSALAAFLEGEAQLRS
jgi:TPR repeat protein